MLSAFDQACRTDGAARVVFFGGSITAGARASDQGKTSWRALVSDRLAARRPDAAVTCINAGIGGTGSEFGCCRMAEDVTAHDPHLVFVEFAVNDRGTPPMRVRCAYEGILRRLRTTCPACAIVGVHTLARAFVDAYAAGILPESVRLHQELCDHYGVPTVNVGERLRCYSDASGISLDTFLADDCHPNDAGHAHYAESVMAAVLSGADRVLPDCPSARTPGWWRDGQLITADRLAFGSEWTARSRHVWGMDIHERSCAEPGTRLDLPFSGSVVGLLCVRQRASGIVAWSVDDGAESLCTLWDEYCPKFERTHYIVLTDALADGNHVLHLRVCDERPAGSTGTAVDLFGLMTARR